MGGSKRKKGEESSPNGSATADDEESSKRSRPPSTTASEKESEKPVVRKSGRKRVAKRRSPSPSPPPPPRARKPAKVKRAPVKKVKAAHGSTWPATLPPPRKPQGKPAASRPKSASPKVAPPLKPTVKKAPPKLPPPPKPPTPVQLPAEESSSEESEDDDFRSDCSTVMSEDPLEYPNARAGIYAPLLRKRQKRQSDCIPVVPLPQRTIGGVRDQLQKRRVCNCKQSGCLKLYCDCFVTGLYCTDECNCVMCKNNSHHPRARSMAIDVILMRNPNAFRPRLQPGNTMSSASSVAAVFSAFSKTTPPPRPEKGCKCKKSSCLKKYCECFLAMHYCTPTCGCKECKNKTGSAEREKLMSERRLKAKVEAAARQQWLGRNQMPSQLKHPQEVMGGAALSTADIVRANTVARGVDLFLPPSSQAVPFKLENGRQYPAIAFVRAGSIQGTANRGKLKNTPADLKKKVKASPPARLSPLNEKHRYETDLEKLWRVETDRVGQTFTKVHADLQKVLSPQKFRVKETQTPYNRTNAMIDYRARMATDGVMHDTKDMVAAMNRAETNTLKRFDEEMESGDESSARSASNDEAGRKRDVTGAVGLDESELLCNEEALSLESSELDAASLLCEEEMGSSEGRELTDGAVRELTVLAAQETALIRQLALIIRRKTLTLTDQRLRLVEDARRNSS